MSALTEALVLLSVLVLENGRRWGEVAFPFQWEDAAAVLDQTGVRNHWLGRARGSSKTTDMAAILVVVMLLQMRDGARLYSLAADRDQGRLVLTAMRGLVSRTPILKGALEFSAHKVVVPGRDIVLEVLPADPASSWGLIPDFIVLDEVGQWAETDRSRELYQSLRTSCVKKLAPFVVITTAGHPGGWAYEQREHARVDVAWRLNEVPGPAPWNDVDALAEQERGLPRSSFRRLYHNEWLETDDRLASSEELEALVAHGRPLPPQSGVRYFIGVDLGFVHDQTAIAVCHVEETTRDGREFPEFLRVVDQVKTWAGSRENPVRAAEVAGWLLTEARRLGDVRIVMDEWQAVPIAQDLERKGIHVETVPFTPQLKSRIALELFVSVRERTLVLPDDPDLLRELSLARLRSTPTGHHYLDHDPGEHDDQASAVGLGLTMALEDARRPGPRLRTLR